MSTSCIGFLCRFWSFPSEEYLLWIEAIGCMAECFDDNGEQAQSTGQVYIARFFTQICSLTVYLRFCYMLLVMGICLQERFFPASSEICQHLPSYSIRATKAKLLDTLWDALFLLTDFPVYGNSVSEASAISGQFRYKSWILISPSLQGIMSWVHL